MSNVLYRNFTLDMPLAERAEGSWIWDQEGKKYLDLSGGAFVNALGHGRKDLIQRIADRMKKLSYVNGWHFTSSPMEEYAQKLLKYAPKGMSHVGLLSSGSEAIEAAIKIVRQSFCEEGKSKKHKVIARSPGYHGNVGMAFAASARKNYKKYFSPYITEVAFVSAPQENDGQKVNFTQVNFADELEKKIIELGPENVSTFILETIMGSSGACSVPHANYFSSIAAVCKKYDVKIIADEVACGAGRTGAYFACHHFNFVPDVLVMGKGVNAGLIPTSVLVVSEEIISKIKKGSGGFMHHQTYMHSPMMASCALEVLLEIEKENLVEKVKQDGIYLGDLLKKEILPLAHVGRVSGKGFFWVVTLMKDKKSFFPAEDKIIMKLFKKSKESGLILWPVTGEEESLQSDAFVLAPPYTMFRHEMEEGVQKLKELLSF